MSTTSWREDRDSEKIEIGAETVEGVLVDDEAAASDTYIENLFHNFTIVAC